MRKNKILWPLVAMMCVLVCVFALAGCEQQTPTPPQNGDMLASGVVYWEMDGVGYQWSLQKCTYDDIRSGKVEDWTIATDEMLDGYTIVHLYETISETSMESVLVINKSDDLMDEFVHFTQYYRDRFISGPSVIKSTTQTWQKDQLSDGITLLSCRLF